MGHKFKRKQFRAQASSEDRESSKGERVGKEAEDIDIAEEDILEELAADGYSSSS